MHLERITSGLNVDQETELQCLVHQLQLSDKAPGTSTSILVISLSLDCTSLLTLYFLEETDEYGTSIEITDMIGDAIPRDEYSDEMLMVDMSQIINDVHLETADYYPKSAILRL